MNINYRHNLLSHYYGPEPLLEFPLKPIEIKDRNIGDRDNYNALHQEILTPLLESLTTLSLFKKSRNHFSSGTGGDLYVDFPENIALAAGYQFQGEYRPGPCISSLPDYKLNYSLEYMKIDQFRLDNIGLYILEESGSTKIKRFPLLREIPQVILQALTSGKSLEELLSGETELTTLRAVAGKDYVWCPLWNIKPEAVHRQIDQFPSFLDFLLHNHEAVSAASFLLRQAKKLQGEEREARVLLQDVAGRNIVLASHLTRIKPILPSKEYWRIAEKIISDLHCPRYFGVGE